MDQSFHYLIMINQALFQKKALKNLMEIELTPGQPKVLDFLFLHDGSMQKDIAYGCQIEPATLTGILAHMEDNGLVERHMKNGNRRSSYVYLTDDGREKAIKVIQIFGELEEVVFKGIDKKDREQFIKIFYQICYNMTETEGLQ
ncbi:MAG: MarR family winged helix-turn-helix transcriptional regulator [Lachnotalea sp.]